MERHFDFNTGPDKIFVDATNTAMMPGALVTALHSGSEAHVFVFQIHHAKQFARILMQNVEAYEKQFGPVDGRLPNEPMQSPIQIEGKTGEGPEKP